MTPPSSPESVSDEDNHAKARPYWEVEWTKEELGIEPSSPDPKKETVPWIHHHDAARVDHIAKLSAKERKRLRWKEEKEEEREVKRDELRQAKREEKAMRSRIRRSREEELEVMREANRRAMEDKEMADSKAQWTRATGR